MTPHLVADRYRVLPATLRADESTLTDREAFYSCTESAKYLRTNPNDRTLKSGTQEGKPGSLCESVSSAHEMIEIEGTRSIILAVAAVQNFTTEKSYSGRGKSICNPTSKLFVDSKIEHIISRGSDVWNGLIVSKTC